MYTFSIATVGTSDSNILRSAFANDGSHPINSKTKVFSSSFSITLNVNCFLKEHFLFDLIVIFFPDFVCDYHYNLWGKGYTRID